MKRRQPRIAQRSQIIVADERTGLDRQGGTADAKRARKTRAYEEQLVKKFVDELGLINLAKL